MAAPAMESTVAALIAPGKDILAADESFSTIEKRFKALNIASTETNRHAYRELLPANLIQARRDYFGAHTYERIDAKGTFHTQWEKE